ncbi:ribosomal RNA processing protein 1 homolog [Anastrepha ludens]|uniref:ribosomal RNA processing protein 1 homolog n=1 Tax=Anastrepha ludens TaxID=28586 RepID=UPI0023B0BA2C|nr:ribosomal RNA processing protein 1 homolog [Anastrepha ludens]
MVIMKAKKIKKPFNSRKFLRNSDVAEKDAAKEESESEVVPEHIRIIEQEVQIVRALACNDLNKRNRQIRKLRKWLELRACSSFPLTEDDFLRIWKGLYYNMWMSDKPLVQENLAEQLGKLTECFDGDVNTSVNFFGAFMQTMCNEWFGIDQWRIDKFMMLVRRMLRYMFRVLKRSGWTKESIKLFNDHMKLTVLADESPAIGLTMHFLDIFFEELAKVSEGDISAEQVGDFVRPFVTYLAKGRDAKLVSHCRLQVLKHMLYQSALGREYTEKFNAWERMGFPTTSINDLEKVDEDNEENGEEDDGTETTQKEQHLDPRAGDVDVFMPELPLDAKYVIEELERLIYKDDDISTKIRKSLRKQLDIFKTYQQGEFPLGVKRIQRFKAKAEKPLMKDKIEQLENVENELFSVGRKLKQLNKRKRRKLLKSLNFEEIDESNFDQTILKAIPKQYLKERKRKATSGMSGWVEEEISEEDLLPNKKLKGKKNIEVAPAQDSTNTKEHETQDVDEIGVTTHINKEAERIQLDKTKTSKTNALKGPIEQDKTKDKPIKVQGVTTQINKETEETQPKKNKASKTNVPKTPLVEQDKAKDKPIKVQGLTTQINKETEGTQLDKIKTSKTNVPKAPIIEKDRTKDKPIKVQEAQAKEAKSKWDTPLAEGEVEYFIPSRKIQLKEANVNLVPNPMAKKLTNKTSTPISAKKGKAAFSTPTMGSVKRVKIALKHNTMQNPSEYIKQIKSSPNLPYDADKKPGKGLLKPNSMPSPINPFYKKKIGLRLANDTI